MKTIAIYDAKARKLTTEREFGMCGFISYGRLVQALRDHGQVRSGETVSQLILTDEGIEIVYGDGE